MTLEPSKKCPDCTATLPLKAKFCSECGHDFTGPWIQRQREGIPGLRRTKLTSERESPEVGAVLDDLASKFAHGSRPTLGEMTAALVLSIEEAGKKGDWRTIKDIYRGIMYENADISLQIKKAVVRRKERAKQEQERKRKEEAS